MYSSKQKSLSQYPLPTQLIFEAAKKLKAKPEIIDKKTGFLIKITFKDKSNFFGLGAIPKFPIHDSVKFGLMKDKAFSYIILEEAKIKIPKGNYFFKEEIKEALKYAKKIGYPVFLKPNSKSMGRLCQKIYFAKDLKKRLKEIFRIDRVALIQKPVLGKEYRLLILDNKILLAYQKTPPKILGDGKSTISRLISQKNKVGQKEIKIDKIIKEKLKQLNLTFKSILLRGKIVILRDNANLSTGGEIVTEIKLRGQKVKKMIKKISEIFGSRFYALDLKTQNIWQPKSWVVLEVNGDPLLSEFYQRNPQKVIEIYKKIIKACF